MCPNPIAERVVRATPHPYQRSSTDLRSIHPRWIHLLITLTPIYAYFATH